MKKQYEVPEVKFILADVQAVCNASVTSLDDPSNPIIFGEW